MIENISIDTLIPDPSNSRKHSKKNLDAIKGSLARFGQQKPIVVSHDNVVIAGNGTLQAAKALGWTEISVVRSDLAGSDVTAYAIADNRTGELAEWDDEALQQSLRALSEENFNLNEIGFSDKELDKILKNAAQVEKESKDFNQMFEVVIECTDEMDQESVFSEMTGRGYKCRVLSM